MASRSAAQIPAASEFNHSTAFDFETNFDEKLFMQWMLKNWTLCFWFAGVYLLLVFGGKYYMASRPRFDLRPALALWSAILAVFSIFGAIRTIPEFTYVIHNYGLKFSVCNPSYYQGPSGLWLVMFTVSKAFELGDTIFIVLRKQPLIFLHWYHHITVLAYAWYSYAEYIPHGRWFMVMNYSVHSLMYSYYTLRALRIRIPRPISILITSLQIVQMVAGTWVCVWAYQMKSRGDACQVTLTNLRYGIVMYVSYLVLFSYFFYNAYLSPKQHPRQQKESLNEKME